MTDWQKIIDSDCAVPPGHPIAGLLAELVEMLRSRDPVVRDTIAYSVTATWIDRGVLDEHLTALGDEMMARFDDPDIQARTFAPLILDEIVTRGAFDPTWLAAFIRWYRAETDIRGFDAELGWLHAIAHGADLLAAFGRSPQLGGAELVNLLELAAARLLTPTDYVFAAWEDDRVASAVVAILTRAELTEQQATSWLTPIADEVAAARRLSPVPAWTSNTVRTLRMLYLLVDRGMRPSAADGQAERVLVRHRDPLRERIAEVLTLVTPRLG